MADKNYPIEKDPVYDPNIRALQDTDPAQASTIFNPLFEKIINNGHAVKLASDGKAPTNHASSATTHGIATASLYGHPMASSATPLANGTATPGTDNGKFAREGHVHPADNNKADANSFNNHTANQILHIPYAVVSGSANVYTATLNPAPTAYTDGMALAAKINVANTGTSTINVNGLGAKNILKPNGSALSSGNLKAASIYTMRYNGTNFILQGSVASGDAIPAEVLTGKKFTNDSADGLTGTMPNRGTVNITPGKTEQTISEGYHDGKGRVASLGGNATTGVVVEGWNFSSDVAGRNQAGTVKNNGTVNITPGKAEQSIPIGYHNGNGKVASLGGTVPANLVHEHYSFSSNAAGREVRGTMPHRGDPKFTPTTNNQNIPFGYYGGDAWVYGDGNLQPGNIRAGVSIFGVNGNVASDKGPVFTNVQYIDITIPYWDKNDINEVNYNINPVDFNNSYTFVSPFSGTSAAYLYSQQAIFELINSNTIKVSHRYTSYAYTTRIWIVSVNPARAVINKTISANIANNGHFRWELGSGAYERLARYMPFTFGCRGSYTATDKYARPTSFLPPVYSRGYSAGDLDGYIYYYFQGFSYERCDFGAGVLYFI